MPIKVLDTTLNIPKDIDGRFISQPVKGISTLSFEQNGLIFEYNVKEGNVVDLDSDRKYVYFNFTGGLNNQIIELVKAFLFCKKTNRYLLIGNCKFINRKISTDPTNEELSEEFYTKNKQLCTTLHHFFDVSYVDYPSVKYKLINFVKAKKITSMADTDNAVYGTIGVHSLDFIFETKEDFEYCIKAFRYVRPSKNFMSIIRRTIEPYYPRFVSVHMRMEDDFDRAKYPVESELQELAMSRFSFYPMHIAGGTFNKKYADMKKTLMKKYKTFEADKSVHSFEEAALVDYEISCISEHFIHQFSRNYSTFSFNVLIQRDWKLNFLYYVGSRSLFFHDNKNVFDIKCGLKTFIAIICDKKEINPIFIEHPDYYFVVISSETMTLPSLYNVKQVQLPENKRVDILNHVLMENNRYDSFDHFLFINYDAIEKMDNKRDWIPELIGQNNRRGCIYKTKEDIKKENIRIDTLIPSSAIHPSMIEKAIFGTSDEFVDVTDKLKTLLASNMNKFRYTDEFSDPANGKVKQLTLMLTNGIKLVFSENDTIFVPRNY